MSVDKHFTLSVAPMMDWTDKHCRYFHRLLSRHALLYTEMVTTGAILHGDRDRLLGFSPIEQPVALQLGGSDPDDLARAAVIGAAGAVLLLAGRSRLQLLLGFAARSERGLELPGLRPEPRIEHRPGLASFQRASIRVVIRRE